MPSAVIIDAIRTPIGRYGGALKDVRPDDLAALVLKELLRRNASLASESVEDVILGCANQAGEDNRNIARMSLLLAGFSETVAGATVNRLCGSGLMAINQAAHAIRAGEAEIYIAGGVESMTRAPFVLPKAGSAFSRAAEIYDTTIGWRFTNPALSELYHPYSMGETAENVAERYNISRQAQDLFALESQQKTAAAKARGFFGREIVAVPVVDKISDQKTPRLVNEDEHPRPETTLEQLAKLKPAFKEGGSVTAGNSSGVNDGACALLIMSEAKAKALGLKPKARIVSTAVAGVDPACMGIGPVPATQKALKRAGLGVDALDLIELNEAFSAQSLACLQELNFDPAKVNRNGGAIALGHPLGMSGARLVTTLLNQFEETPTARYALATMCIGVGQGIATVLERY
ncbi:MAG: 3-oxoadipyl-CoA thiolase [Vampirovibrionales bacterium]|nr:3-oxoadipyl-CoA thiolase [Vampirovibrionales bacterium]